MEQHLPVSEVAAKLSCCEETVKRMIRSGRLPAVKLGGQYRVAEGTIAASLGTGRNKPQQKGTGK